MGVPGLAPWIRRNFPSHWRTIAIHRKEVSPFTVDRLYIDGNALLHPAAQTAFYYGSKAGAKDRYEGKSYDDRLNALFKMFFFSIRKLVAITKPSKAVYIALDGSAPLAKQAQQRIRRFGLIPSDGQSRKPAEKFDPSSITPGTPFMLELVRFMNARIRQEIDDSRTLFHRLDVVFSPPTRAGEGEHKLMDFIRAGADEDSHCLCGPDGDLLMLALATRKSKIYILREDQFVPEMYDMIDMGSILRGMPMNLVSPKTRAELSPTSAQRLIDRCVDDFILIGFLVGNDFLPRIEMFQRLDRGLDLMIDIYRENVTVPLTRATSKGAKINMRVFNYFLVQLQGIEVRELNRLSTEKPRSEGGVDFTNHTLLRNSTGGRVDWQGFRRDYYAKSNLVTDKDIAQLCFDYSRTLCWILQYYTGTIPSWTWYYPWHYAPLMTDLAHYSNRDNDERSKASKVCAFRLGTPSEPFLQLLTVTPKQSAVFLPEPLRKLYDEEPLSQFKNLDKKALQDFEGKLHAHMAIVRLPFVNVVELKEKYDETKKLLTQVYVRNEPGRDIMFRYTPSYAASFKSTYWSSPEMHVTKTLL